VRVDDMRRNKGSAISSPKRVVVEYENGTTKAIDFRKLSEATQAGISRAVDDSSSLDPKPDAYVLLRWKDGWQEVVSTKGRSVELLRYHVIRRIEDQGRLALEAGTTYPQLYIIDRIPRELSSVLILGQDGTKYYEFDSEVETCEGIFEAGGKKEYTRYDRTNPRHTLGDMKGSKALCALLNSARAALKKEKLTSEDLLTKDKGLRNKDYEMVARQMGIRGKERQQDVYAFIEVLLTKLGPSRAQ
jgi:hypothetical protein